MRLNKGIAIGFVAGLAVAGGAALLLWDHEARAQETARVAHLDAQIQRLEQAVSKLSGVAPSGAPGAEVPATVSRAGAMPPTPVASTVGNKPDADQARAIAEADALVDRGIQSGQWTQEQALELTAATAGLDVKEQGRILARVSAAINAGQLQVELP